MVIDLLLIVAAYLIGSLSSAIIVCKFWGLPDPRSEGSNNPGATNVLRIGGKLPGAVTLVGDGLKGFLTTLLAVQIHAPIWVVACVMLAALLGHIWPIFFRFQGGKGVATAMGTYLGVFWPLGLSLVAIWASVIYLSRYSSLGAIVATLVTPLLTWWFLHNPTLTAATSAMALLLLYRHEDNIRRLIKGQETKV